MPAPFQDRRELKQRQQELSRQLADTLLSQESPIKEASNYQQDWQQHQVICEEQQSLALLDSKLMELLPGIEQRERLVAEAKKAVEHEVKALRQFAAELGERAFAALLSGDVVATPCFEARKALHDHLESLNREKGELGQADPSKLTEKVKLKARQLKMAGEIKMGQLKIGSLDRTLGESLLNETEEASVDSPHTKEVLEAITGQRAAIATANEKQEIANSQLADSLDEAARTLDRESVVGASVLQVELKQVRKDARSIETSIAASRSAIVGKALEDETLRDNEQLGPNLNQLGSVQFDLKTSQSQVFKVANNVTSRFSTLSPPIKYTISGAVICLLLIIGAVWFGDDDDSGSSLSQENEAKDNSNAPRTTPANVVDSNERRDPAQQERELEDSLRSFARAVVPASQEFLDNTPLVRLFIEETITLKMSVHLRMLDSYNVAVLSTGAIPQGVINTRVENILDSDLLGRKNIKMGSTQTVPLSCKYRDGAWELEGDTLGELISGLEKAGGFNNPDEEFEARMKSFDRQIKSITNPTGL